MDGQVKRGSLKINALKRKNDREKIMKRNNLVVTVIASLFLVVCLYGCKDDDRSMKDKIKADLEQHYVDKDIDDARVGSKFVMERVINQEKAPYIIVIGHCDATIELSGVRTPVTMFFRAMYLKNDPEGFVLDGEYAQMFFQEDEISPEAVDCFLNNKPNALVAVIHRDEKVKRARKEY